MYFCSNALRAVRWCAPVALLLISACGPGEEASTAPASPGGIVPLGLTVTVSGQGSITSAPGGIDCGLDCSESYAEGTSVTLTETPAAGQTFVGWSGSGVSCGTSSTCTVPMSAARSVTATFQTSAAPPTTPSPPSTPQYALTVAKSGSGTVTSSPAGISCGADCTENYASGTNVTLTAVAGAGSMFSAWSGAGISCAGTAPCTVTMSEAKSLTATFATQPVPTTAALQLSVTGSGRVTSSPAGIDCPGDCSEDFQVGTTVTLTATADSGFLFSGWGGGGCSVNSACAVVMSASLAVSGAFAAVGVTGKTYFVSPSGSDTSTGLSLATPFKTINKAVSVVNAGDTIEVRSGTYSENVVIRRPGAANSWITMRGYNGEAPVIRGTSSGPSIYFYANACDESAIGSGSGNADCQPMYWVIHGMVVREAHPAVATGTRSRSIHRKCASRTTSSAAQWPTSSSWCGRPTTWKSGATNCGRTPP